MIIVLIKFKYVDSYTSSCQKYNFFKPSQNIIQNYWSSDFCLICEKTFRKQTQETFTYLTIKQK